MNEFEEQLRQLRPAPIPARLSRRLEQAVAPGRWYELRWPAWAAATAALVLLLVGVKLRFSVPGRLPVEVAQVAAADCPPEVLRVLCGQRDEGIVLVAATTPYRQVRRRYVDLYTWDHCLRGARQDYSVAAEEVVLLPVAVY